MDVDPPLPHPVLKRCSSAPMISECEQETGAVAATSSATTSSVSAAPSPSRTSPTFILCSTFEPRTRRFSASFSPLHSPGTPGSPRVPPSRVSQLKKEEACDAVGREVASEKEFQSTLQISASWEDLSLSDTDSKEPKTEPLRRPSSACTEPIHVTLPINGLAPFVSSPYPSPTRVSGRQCFSPSMQIPVRNSSFSPTPSPSPTRKTFYTSRRSLSPIAIRASPLGPVKRKCDLEERGDSAWGPSKKYQHFSPATSNSCGGPLLVTQMSSSGESGESSAGIVGRNHAIPTPDSQSASASSPSDSGSTPSPLQVCKIVDSPANSPGGRRSSITGGESSNSRSRDRTSCVVPSPLAATNTIEDVEGELKTNNPIGRERKDFSRLFVPIPPSPGAMDCCTVDSEESTASHEFSTNKNREQVSKEYASVNGVDFNTMDENMEEPAIVSSQEHSMSVDSSHSPMDPST